MGLRARWGFPRVVDKTSGTVRGGRPLGIRVHSRSFAVSPAGVEVYAWIWDMARHLDTAPDFFVFQRRSCGESRELLSPGGRFENSPAVHCRVQIGHSRSPAGTAECSECHASVLIPIHGAAVRSSLRDLMLYHYIPTLERVGYSQISLRETAAESPVLFD